VDLPALSRWRGVTDFCRAVFVVGLSATRYPFCVLVSAIGWCGALSNILRYAWFLTHWHRDELLLPAHAYSTAFFDLKL
jgi:hypothetical protein